MKINKLKISEIDKFFKVFCDVISEGFPEYGPQLIEFILKKDFSKKYFLSKLKEKEINILTATEGSEIVGFLVEEKIYGGVGYCNWLGVIKQQRGKGIGRSLLQKWEKQTKSRGGHKLMLITQSEKDRVFYKKCGFKEEGYEKKSWFGLDSRIFGKVISEFKPEVIYRKKYGKR